MILYDKMSLFNEFLFNIYFINLFKFLIHLNFMKPLLYRQFQLK